MLSSRSEVARNGMSGTFKAEQRRVFTDVPGIRLYSFFIYQDEEEIQAHLSGPENF